MSMIWTRPNDSMVKFWRLRAHSASPCNRHVFYRVGDSVLLLFNPDETEKPPGNPDLPVPPHGARGAGHVCLTLCPG